MHSTAMPFKDDVQDFFLAKALEDPDHWEELAEQYPINSEYDEARFSYGEPPKRRRNRQGKSGGVPKEHRRKFDDEEWQQVQRSKKNYYDEYRENLKYAQELADEGMG